MHSLFRKITNMNTVFTKIDLFTTLLIMDRYYYFSLSVIWTFLFSLITIATSINQYYFYCHYLFNTLYSFITTNTIRISVLDFLRQQLFYITIWYWTIFGNYRKKKNFIKNFNILKNKIFHSEIHWKKKFFS